MKCNNISCVRCSVRYLRGFLVMSIKPGSVFLDKRMYLKRSDCIKKAADDTVGSDLGN